jgi:TolA-binding protein
MRRASLRIAAAGAALLLSAGCGEFRQRAQETETRITEVERGTDVAEQVLTQNAARIRDLERRVSELEQLLKGRSSGTEDEGGDEPTSDEPVSSSDLQPSGVG